MNPLKRVNWDQLLSAFGIYHIQYPVGNSMTFDQIHINSQIATINEGILKYSGFLNDNVSVNIIISTNEINNRKICDFDVHYLSKLSECSNIFLKFYGAFIDNGRIVIVYENHGETIDEIIKKRSGNYNYFTEEEIIGIFRDLFEGFKYLFERKIYHNNAKSTTLYINEFNRIKISDFALPFLERQIEIDQTISLMRREETKSDKNYLAPEILEITGGIRDGNFTNFFYSKCYADIYSLGLVLYEIISLQKAIEFNLRRNSVATHSKIDLCNPKWAAAIIKRMIDFNPSNRPSIEELIQLIPN